MAEDSTLVPFITGEEKLQTERAFFDERGLDDDTGKIAKDIADLWDKEDTFKVLQEKRKDSKKYTIFDGPPFATGAPHYGHFLPMALKDWAQRYHSMKGEKASMKAGWDTHGLPVEALVQKELGLATTMDVRDYGVQEFSDACHATVLRYVNEWKATQRAMGRWIDMEAPYATMDANYIESVWWVFSELYKKGLVYEGKKVVAYSPALGTPLSNFEADQNYKEIEDTAVTVSFALEDGSKMLAWTTTPWSVVSNLALAVGEDIDYVKVVMKGTTYILAKERLSILEGKQYEVVEELKGKALVGLKYTPPFGHFKDTVGTQNSFRVVASDHVTLGTGTGIVHIAPAYGEEDFSVGEKNGIGLVDPIDHSGHFTNEVPELLGINFRDANPRVRKMLEESGHLFASETVTHSYPHCYRTDQPLIYKAVPSWFIQVTALKDRMAELNEGVNWVPDHLKNGRFGDWINNARDWAVSRNRFWGAPLPIWKCEETGEVIVVSSRKELFELTGQHPEDLHKAVIDAIPITKDGKQYKRVPEIFDCWFESGAMPYASIHHPFEKKDNEAEPVPADFIAEGLDQTRGWFYTLTVLSTALYDKPAFKNVVVNGMVLAEDDEGNWVKMSKKLRNYPDPNDLMERVGGDAIRFFILGSGAAKAEPLKFSEAGVDQTVKKVLLPLWNIYKFFVMYANADGWKREEGYVEQLQKGKGDKPTHLLDQWALALLEKSHEEVTSAYEANDLPRATKELANLISDISQWYVRLSRDRFWKADDEGSKVSAYKTLYEILVRYSQMIAPICPFISEKIYKELTKEPSVHHSLWPEANESHREPGLVVEMEEMRKVVSAGLALRKGANIRVRQPLAEVAIVREPGSDFSKFSELIAAELNVKKVRMVDQGDEAVFEAVVNLNRAKLGKKLKADLQTVIRKLGEGDYVLKDGVLLVANHELSLSEGDFTLSYKPKGGRVTEEKEGRTVVFDLEISEELKMEGMARDLIRMIQNRRKDDGLHITDRIGVEIETADASIEKMVDAFRSMIAYAVLGSDIRILKESVLNDAQVENEKDRTEELAIETHPFRLRIRTMTGISK